MALTAKPKRRAPRQQDTVREQLARPTAEESKRLNVPVPPDLYRQMKEQAVREDRTLAEISRELWLRYLDRGEGQ